MSSILPPLAYLGLLLGSLLLFARFYPSLDISSKFTTAPTSSTASDTENDPSSWSLDPATIEARVFGPHSARDTYYALLASLPPQDKLTQAQKSLLQAALVRRAVTDVHRLWRVRELKPVLHTLGQRDLYPSTSADAAIIPALELTLQHEIQELLSEADTFLADWGSGSVLQPQPPGRPAALPPLRTPSPLLTTATEIAQNERQRQKLGKEAAILKARHAHRIRSSRIPLPSASPPSNPPSAPAPAAAAEAAPVVMADEGQKKQGEEVEQVGKVEGKEQMDGAGKEGSRAGTPVKYVFRKLCLEFGNGG